MKTLHSHENMFIFIFSLLFPLTSLAIDTITSTTPLTSNQTLVSNGDAFELGFFSTSDGKNLYVGIWYKQIQERTYVWVANRDNPINSSSGKLTIGENGNLILVDQSETAIWSSNQSVPVANVVAQLLDDGNFVLRRANDEKTENYIWQSFDHPTDTLLPKMKLGWNKETGNSKFIRSWKSNNDPGSGDYSFKMDIEGFPEIVIWHKDDTKICRSGPWNGKWFSGTPEMKGVSIMNFSFVENSEDIYYSYDTLDSSVYSRLVMNSSGILQRYIWVETAKYWNQYWFFPSDRCDNYGVCGPYSVCDANNAPNCKCMTGFGPKDQQAWALRDGTGGCIRTSTLDCGSDGFLPLKNVRLPEGSKAFIDQNMSLSQCHEICKKNCTCAAYANMDITRGGSGCAYWATDLMDIRQYADAEGGQDLYIRVSASDFAQAQSPTTENSKSGSSNDSQIVKIVASTIGGVCAVLIILLVLIYLKRRKIKRLKRSKTGITDTQERSDAFLLNDKVILPSKRDYHGETNMDELELPLLDFATLAKATNNFSDENKLGQGGFGCVHKGTLTEGEVVAIKRLSTVSDQGIEELKNEVRLIAKLQHRNLVRVLGCCIEVEEKLLIYEFMENKSLNTLLFEKEKSVKLNWNIRFQIICGITRGLLYLHQDSRFKIIHRDLKASNILLDKEMNPKISDFGMARIFGKDQTEAETKKVVGTYGYMSPEYAMDGSYSTKSDVFSFGVLVLEIVSGKKNRGSSYTSTQLSLLGHTWMLWREGNPLELVDESLGEKFSEDEVLRCIQIGLLCVQEQPEDRPSMSKVLLMLSSETSQLPQPKYPGFFIGKRDNETDFSSKQYDSMTINEVTVTTLDAR
ncbi:receptor-like serine/threonine-protein kinase SD1-8 [Tanacetum coccineum]